MDHRPCALVFAQSEVRGKLERQLAARPPTMHHEVGDSEPASIHPSARTIPGDGTSIADYLLT